MGAELPDIARRIREHAPSILLDLGGHTADNHPALLSHRLAAVQATYLGFYGPTFASCCDWWIVDEVLHRWINSSYEGAEKLWALPGPSLCYVPSLHGLPAARPLLSLVTSYLAVLITLASSPVPRRGDLGMYCMQTQMQSFISAATLSKKRLCVVVF